MAQSFEGHQKNRMYRQSGATPTTSTVHTSHITKEQAAQYVGNLTGELSRLARVHDLELVAYFLDMARLEAEENTSRNTD